MVLNAEPSPQAGRFKAAGVGKAQLWDLPYTILKRRVALKPNAIYQRLALYAPFMCSPPPSIYTGPVAPLYKGRILHLKGRLFEEKEAVAYYQRARPRTKDLAAEMPKIAKQRYDALARHFKPSDRELLPAEENLLRQEAELVAQLVVGAIIQGKLSASYWLGLIQYEQGEADPDPIRARGDYDSAMDYFGVRTLQVGPSDFWARGAHHNIAVLLENLPARVADIFWARGALYNIARTFEARGERQEAIETYNSKWLKYHAGIPIRAQWLAALDAGKNKKPAEKPAAAKPETVKPEAAKPATAKPENVTPEEKKAEEKKPAQDKPDDKKPEEKKVDEKKPASGKSGEH